MVVLTVFAVAMSLAPETSPEPRAELPPFAAESPMWVHGTTPAAAPELVSFEPGVAAFEVGTADVPVAVVPSGPTVVDIALPVRPRSVLTAPELELSVLAMAETVDIYNSPQDARPGPVSAQRRFRVLRGRARSMESAPQPIDPTLGPMWTAERPDLRDLPLLEGDDCVLSTEESERLAKVSKEVGAPASQAADSASINVTVTGSGTVSIGKQWSAVDQLVDRSSGYDPSGLHQVLQIAPAETRARLVAKLSESPSQEATKALAQRALYDLDADVRTAAVEALASRPEEGYTAQLLAAFDYPWPAAAEHAADALIALERTDLLEALRERSDAPDPRAPFQKDGEWYARKLVRVNHLRNCLLCHAPEPNEEQGTATQLVATGTVPDPYAPLPRVYYGGPRRGSLLVRADVTYIWQDFSIASNVEDPQTGWPSRQRFDYFVRTARIPAWEVDDLEQRYPRATSPQRHAARYAVEALEAVQLRERRLERVLASR